MPPMPYKHGATLGMHPPSCFNLSDDKHPLRPPDDFHYRRQRWADRFAARAEHTFDDLVCVCKSHDAATISNANQHAPAGRVGKRHQGFDDARELYFSLNSVCSPSPAASQVRTVTASIGHSNRVISTSIAHWYHTPQTGTIPAPETSIDALSSRRLFRLPRGFLARRRCMGSFSSRDPSLRD